MSIKITERILAQRANTLELQLNLSYENNSSNNSNNAYYPYNNRGITVFIPKIGYSTKLTIDDRVAFQAMIFEYKSGVAHYLVKFTKARKNDKLDYIIHFLHHKEGDASKIIDKQFKSDDSWYSVTDSLTYPSSCIVKLSINIVPLTMSYAAIHEDSEFTDFQLRGTDGSVHMHKVVAAACSPFFKTLFAGTWRETANGIVDVPDTSVDTLHQLKDYMYLGKLPESGDVTKLLLLSSFYMMPDLEARCAYELCKHVTTDTAYELIQFAVKHNMAQLIFEILLLIQQGKLDVNEMKNLYKPC